MPNDLRWSSAFVHSALVCAVALTAALTTSCVGDLGNATGGAGGDAVTSSGGSAADGPTGGGGTPAVCNGVTCSGHGKCVAAGSNAACNCDSGYVATDAMTCAQSDAPTVGGCSIFPSNNIFNTPTADLPRHAQSQQFIATIGDANIHLDLGQSTNIDEPDTYYGIPYNIVHGSTLPWAHVSYFSADGDLSWDPTLEADCSDASSGSLHTVVSPCTAAAASHPVFPIPSSPLIEGGVDSNPSQPYGDHHLLLLDADNCRLTELYHVYPKPGGSGWDIFGSAIFDLASNNLRPAGWTSADAAGFPMLPLLLRAEEASTGTIRHALRFTILSSRIRGQYTWPARHLTSNDPGSTNLPPMGQLFRLSDAYVIPDGFNTQSRAILQALKTYGMYLADGGSNLYIQGAPSADWEDGTFSQVQSVDTSQFEAVDLSSIQKRAGFNPDSAAVPQ